MRRKPILFPRLLLKAEAQRETLSSWRAPLLSHILDLILMLTHLESHSFPRVPDHHQTMHEG